LLEAPEVVDDVGDVLIVERGGSTFRALDVVCIPGGCEVGPVAVAMAGAPVPEAASVDEGDVVCRVHAVYEGLTHLVPVSAAPGVDNSGKLPLDIVQAIDPQA
jgi:hypothetical protein